MCPNQRQTVETCNQKRGQEDLFSIWNASWGCGGATGQTKSRVKAAEPRASSSWVGNRSPALEIGKNKYTAIIQHDYLKWLRYNRPCDSSLEGWFCPSIKALIINTSSPQHTHANILDFGWITHQQAREYWSADGRRSTFGFRYD